MTKLSQEQQREMDKIVQGLPTKSEKIRTLARAGYERSAISRFLGIRYQHVRNVLVQAQEKEHAANDSKVPPRHVWTTVGSDGRIQVPPSYLRVLNAGNGEPVLMMLDDGEIRLVSREAAVRRVQKMAAKFVPPGTRLSDELIAERRFEAERESQ